MENNKKKKISIIGSTGSIGTQALEVIEKTKHDPQRLQTTHSLLL